MKKLTWGGVDCQKLAEEYGTPLYVFDTGIIKSRCRELRETFMERWENTTVRYASKAFLIKEMARIIKSEGLGLDVVSLGELYTALKAGFPPEKIEMNGNAKSSEEISFAINSGVGRIIVDHPDELKTIEHFASLKGIKQKILIRVAPGVDAHTHAYIATGQTDSKFGLPVDISEGSMLAHSIQYAMKSEYLDLRGLHFHVGSQLFDPDDNVKGLEKTIELIKKLKDAFNFTTKELNCGGGFGAVINPSVSPVKCADFTDPMMKLLYEDCKKYNLEIPQIIIEPGRWVISEAGITLYKVENIKELPKLTYIAVDGGMADNPRYALYQAEYEAVNVNDIEAPVYDPGDGTKFSVVGKCCESGDILIDDAKLPKLKAGDIIALYNSGAYTFSMSSRYNRLQRPAVIFAEDGQARLVSKRQTLDDMIKDEI